MTTIIENIKPTDDKVLKILALRKQAENIRDYANSITAYCAYISCFDCPMNIAKEPHTIVCISNMEIIR